MKSTMNRTLVSILLLLVLLVPSCQAQDTSQALPPIEVFFSPKGGCTEAVVKELNAAKETVLVQAYSFTSAPIAKALLEAHKRGVKVQVILDKSQRTEKYSEADFLVNARHPDLDRRKARHRPQQDHGDRRRNGHHRQFQFHQGRRKQ